MICPNCGKEVPDDTYYCNGCGYAIKDLSTGENRPYRKQEPAYAFKNKWTAFWLCLLLGVLGVHRFYVKKYGSGIGYALTFGLFGLGWIIDLVSIVSGTFRDKNGYPLM